MVKSSVDLHKNSQFTRIFLLEDENNIGSTLFEKLMSEGFHVTWAKSIEEARHELKKIDYQLAILDVTLPDGSGFDIARQIRCQNPMTAVLFLTALNSPEDRVRGLELGAEDYVSKPFHLKELLLRINNCLKRTSYFKENTFEKNHSIIQVGKALIYFLKFEAQVEKEVYSLTHKEVALLKLLVERRGQVVSRDEILDRAWSEEEFPTSRTVDNFIMRLRRIVEINPESPEVIRSIRGIGYQLI